MSSQHPIASIGAPLNLRFGLPTVGIGGVLALNSVDEIRLRITTKIRSSELLTVEVTLSPRMVIMLFCRSLILQTRQTMKALASRRSEFSALISPALGQALERGPFADGAWTYGESWPDADIWIRIAQSQFMDFFQACAEYRVDQVRCRLSSRGIELQDRIVFEHFLPYEEWKRAAGGGSRRDYRESLEDDAWSVSFPIFALRLSYIDLIEMILLRLRRGLTKSTRFYDDPFSGQWTDLAALLTSILCRLPNDTAIPRRETKVAYNEAITLAKSFLSVNKVCTRPPTLKFRRALPTRYKGLLLAL